jgi:hypothetical protein
VRYPRTPLLASAEEIRVARTTACCPDGGPGGRRADRPDLRALRGDERRDVRGGAADRCGLAAAVCLLAGCAESGARQVLAVIVDTGSDASAALHRRFGFVAAGRLAGVGRKHGRWIDTVLMQRELGQDG